MGRRAEVEQWLAEYLGRQFAATDLNDILGSLRYEGDDADEFLEAFVKRFGVDMSGFNAWHHYDADEPPIYKRYRPISKGGQPLDDLPIGITQLVETVQTGRWTVDYSDRELKYHRPRPTTMFGVIVIAFVCMALIELLRSAL